METIRNAIDNLFGSSTPIDDKIVPFDSTDKDDIAELSRQLKAKGWCLVRLDKDLVETARKLADQLEAFFKRSKEEKQKHCGPFGFGYSEVDHKEGIRLLTGFRLYDFIESELLPKECVESYRLLCSLLDKKTSTWAKNAARPVFGISTRQLGKKADLPVSHGDHFGMLDAAHYYNNKKAPSPQPEMGTSVEEVNCVPHYDPGLFTISFFANNEGLELLDPRTKKWIPGPVNTRPGEEDLGVVWLGEVARKVNSSFQTGVHRVVYPQNGSPRLTLWYEMCTTKQATAPDEKSIKSSSVTIPNLPGSPPIENTKGMNAVHILRQIEVMRGVPMSKVMIIPSEDDW